MSNSNKSWDDNDRVALRQFLKACPHFLEELDRHLPDCEGQTNEHRAATGSELQGARNQLKRIKSMTQDPSPQVRSSEFLTE